jgi:transposase-like protein
MKNEQIELVTNQMPSHGIEKFVRINQKIVIDWELSHINHK